MYLNQPSPLPYLLLHILYFIFIVGSRYPSSNNFNPCKTIAVASAKNKTRNSRISNWIKSKLRGKKWYISSAKNIRTKAILKKVSSTGQISITHIISKCPPIMSISHPAILLSISSLPSWLKEYKFIESGLSKPVEGTEKIRVSLKIARDLNL